MFRKAFTLIELLVVIAIIAILAAILFPVFAQAKESAKVTTVLSQAKQEGTAMVMYGSDNEDNFPLAMGKRPNGGAWGTGLLHPFPADNLTADAAGVWNLPERINMANSAWGNSIQPYTKNNDIMAVTGLKDYVVTGDVYKNPNAKACLTMNGLLHGYSQTGIEAPSTVVLLWPGQGSVNTKGRTSMNPALSCGTKEDCKFNAGGAPSSETNPSTCVGSNACLYTTVASTSVWTFSRRRTPFVRTDSSAKVMTAGTVISPNSIAFGNGVLSDPYASVDSAGANGSYWPCSFDGGGNVVWNAATNYPCYFRPDRTK